MRLSTGEPRILPPLPAALNEFCRQEGVLSDRSFVARKAIQILLAVAVFTVSVHTVHAWNHQMHRFCSSWPDMYYGTNWVNCNSSGSWGPWGGSYSFTDMEESQALSLAADLCMDHTWSCWDTCGSTAYKVYLSGQHSTSTCVYSVDCYDTWSSANSCSQGTTGSFSCSCMYVNMCMPCE